MRNLEIYIREMDRARILDWLREKLGSLEATGCDGDVATFRAVQGDLSVTLTPKIENSEFMSVFVSGNPDQWADDRAFAREAFAALHFEVRCDPGPQYPAPSQFLAITEEGEKVIDWDDL